MAIGTAAAACDGGVDPLAGVEALPVARPLRGLTEPEAEAAARAVVDGGTLASLVGTAVGTAEVDDGPIRDDEDAIVGWAFSLVATPPSSGTFRWPALDCIGGRSVLVDRAVEVEGLAALAVLVDVEHDVVVRVEGTPRPGDPSPGSVRYGDAEVRGLLARPCDPAAGSTEG